MVGVAKVKLIVSDLVSKGICDILTYFVAIRLQMYKKKYRNAALSALSHCCLVYICDLENAAS